MASALYVHTGATFCSHSESHIPKPQQTALDHALHCNTVLQAENQALKNQNRVLQSQTSCGGTVESSLLAFVTEHADLELCDGGKKVLVLSSGRKMPAKIKDVQIFCAGKNYNNSIAKLKSKARAKGLDPKDLFRQRKVARDQNQFQQVHGRNATQGLASKSVDSIAESCVKRVDANPNVKRGASFVPGGCNKCGYVAKACANNHIECVENILESAIARGEDVTSIIHASNDRVFLPVHNAAITGNVDMLAMLLRHGAALDTPAHNGMTPLICAAKSGHGKVCMWLLQRKADPYVRTTSLYRGLPSGSTAIDIAKALANQIERARVLAVLESHSQNLNIGPPGRAVGESQACESWVHVSPLDVRFTHDRISSAFRSGMKIDDAIDAILKQQMDYKMFPAMELVRFGGQVFSLSNRRLYMLRVLAVKGVVKKVVVCVHAFESSRVQRQKHDMRLNRMASKWDRSFSTSNHGMSVKVSSKYDCDQISDA